jgi:hypothetical protein
MDSLKAAVMRAMMLGLVVVSACGGPADTDAQLESTEEAVVGQRCSPYSNGPLPICGTTAEYCDVGSKCSTVGFCAARPQNCLAVIDRVCGCDGVTYPNACEAARRGVSVKAKGSCSPTTTR